MTRMTTLKALTLSGVIAAVGFGAFGPTVVHAQKAKESTKAKTAKKAPSGSWIKVCHDNVPVAKDKKGTICEVMQAKLDPLSGYPQAAITFRYAKDNPDQVGISINVPLGMALRGGVSLFANEEKQPLLQAPFGFCLESGCIAELPVNKIVLEKFRKSKDVKVVSITVNRRQYVQALTLNGFSKTWDGKPIDKQEFLKARKNLAKVILQNRKKYVEQVKAKRAEAAAKGKKKQ